MEVGEEINITDELHREAVAMAAERFPGFNFAELNLEVSLDRGGVAIPRNVPWMVPIRRYNFPRWTIIAPMDVRGDQRMDLIRRGPEMGLDWLKTANLPVHILIPAVRV